MKNQASQGVSYLLFDVLNIRVVLNQNTLIDPEIQVINEHNRPERSLSFRASLFKARTWEELRMLSQNNEYLKEASETVYHLTQEEKVRLQCQAREDYYRRMKGIQEKFEQLKQYKAEIKQYEAQKVQYEAQKVQYEAEKKQFEAQKAQFAAEKIQSDTEIADLKQQIAALKKELEAKSRE